MSEEVRQRRFVVRDTVHQVLQGMSGEETRWGTLCANAKISVGVCIRGQQGFLVLRGGERGPAEYEQPIPLDLSERLLEVYADHVLKKTRYLVPFQGRTWNVDVFHWRLKYITLATVNAGRLNECPFWVGQEVTDLPQFSEAHLAGCITLNGAPPTVEDLLATRYLPLEPPLEDMGARTKAAYDMFANWMKK